MPIIGPRLVPDCRCWSICCAVLRASGFVWRIELSLGPLWSSAEIRDRYMSTSEAGLSVPAANIDWICVIVLSSLLDAGPVWGGFVGVLRFCLISGIAHRT